MRSLHPWEVLERTLLNRQFTGHTYLGGQRPNLQPTGLWFRPSPDPRNTGGALGAATRSAPDPHGPGAIERAEMRHPPPRRVANPPSRRDGEQ